MKVPTDNIYQLIQSMTASEKRYFKRHYASEKNLTTDLFDFINSMDEYEEESVKRHFANSKLAKNLKVYKVQLMELLLKSLTSYHNKKSIRSKIRMGLEEVEILMDKQLHSMALSRLRKIKDLCLKHEELEYIFAITYFEIFLSSFFDVNLNPSDYAVLQELESHIDTLKRIYNLKRINFFLNDKNNNELTQTLAPEDVVAYEKLLQQELAIPETHPLTLSEQYYRNSSLSIIHKLAYQDAEAEFQYKKSNVELFEANPHFIKSNAGFYFAALFNFLVCCRRLNRFKELEAGLLRIKALLQQAPFLKRNCIFIYYLETKHLFLQRQYHSIVEEMEPDTIKHINKYQQKGEHLTALIFIYFTLTHLVLKDYHKVHFYLRRLSNLSKDLNPGYTHFFHLLELISHQETADQFVIQNLLSSHRRKNKNRKKPSPFFTETLEFFRLLGKVSPEERLASIEKFEQQLDQITTDGTLNIAREFILDDWLRALKNNHTYAEEMTSS